MCTISTRPFIQALYWKQYTRWMKDLGTRLLLSCTTIQKFCIVQLCEDVPIGKLSFCVASFPGPIPIFRMGPGNEDTFCELVTPSGGWRPHKIFLVVQMARSIGFRTLLISRHLYVTHLRFTHSLL